MCFELDSEPPIPRIAGAAVSHDDLVLEAADGNRFGAFLATPEEPAATGIVILPDVRGLYRFYEELALRFAERGYAAVAFDYFGRTAGIEKRPNDWDYMAHVQQTTPDGVQADVAACVAELKTRAAPARFSRSASASAAATRGSPPPPVTGSPARSASTACPRSGTASPGPTQRAAEMSCPVLALQAGDDGHITAEHNAEFDAALAAAGVEHEVVTYPGAPHSFFDRKQEDFADASDDAWNRVLAFVERYA